MAAPEQTSWCSATIAAAMRNDGPRFPVTPDASSEIVGCEHPARSAICACVQPAPRRSSMSCFRSIPLNISAIRYLGNRHSDRIGYQNSDMPKPEDLTTFGGRLRAAREAKKWNQKQLAKAAGISQPLVSELESNRYSGTANMVMLAHVTGVRPLWLERGRGPRMASDPTPDAAHRVAHSERPAAPRVMNAGKSGFEDRLAKAMNERKVTAAKLAARLHVPKGRVDAWLREDGDMPSAAQLFAIADALPASPRWLATGVGELSGTDVAVPLRVEVEGDEFKLLQLFRLMREPEREKLLSYAKWVIDNTPLPDNVVPLEPTSNGKPRRR